MSLFTFNPSLYFQGSEKLEICLLPVQMEIQAECKHVQMDSLILFIQCKNRQKQLNPALIKSPSPAGALIFVLVELESCF